MVGCIYYYIISVTQSLNIYRNCFYNSDQYKRLLKYVLENCNLENSNICHELIRGLGHFGYAKLIYKTYYIMKTKNITITKMDFENGIIASGKCHYFRESIEIFEYMKTMGIADKLTYDNIINAMKCCGKVDECLNYFDEMQNKGYKPNPIMLNTILNLFVENNRYSEAMAFFKDMKNNNYYISTVSYNILLSYLCKINDQTQIQDLLDDMEKNNIKKDVITYSTLITGSGKAHDMKTCLNYLKEYRKVFSVDNIQVIDSICRSCIFTDNIKLGINILNKSNVSLYPHKKLYDHSINLHTLSSSIATLIILRTLSLEYNKYKNVKRRFISDINFKTGKGKLINALTKAILNEALIPKLNISEVYQGDSFVVIPSSILQKWFQYYDTRIEENENLLSYKYYDINKLSEFIDKKDKLFIQNDYIKENNNEKIQINEILSEVLKSN